MRLEGKGRIRIRRRAARPAHWRWRVAGPRLPSTTSMPRLWSALWNAFTICMARRYHSLVMSVGYCEGSSLLHGRRLGDWGGDGRQRRLLDRLTLLEGRVSAQVEKQRGQKPQNRHMASKDDMLAHLTSNWK
jgi:hypothetical protein